MKTVEHRIGGAATAGISARTADVYNPATGQVQGARSSARCTSA
jgi:hypothetical protein